MAAVVTIVNKSKQKQFESKFFDPNFLERKFGGVWGKAPHKYPSGKGPTYNKIKARDRVPNIIKI